MKNAHVKPEVLEAGSIMRLVKMGTLTLESARELIEIPQAELNILTAFAATGGKNASPVAYALRFRELVLQEFEKLVQADRPTMEPQISASIPDQSLN